MLEELLQFEPKVEGTFERAPIYVCGGMGGSAFPPLALRFLEVAPCVIVHRDYNLPKTLLEGAACVALSYSGDTEETLSFAREAVEKGMRVAVITGGGRLLDFAKENSLPCVQVPTGTGIEPRDAMVYMTKALLALVGEDALLAQLNSGAFDSVAAERAASGISTALEGAVPVFYSSTRNELISYLGKIQCNETAKIPAFSNVFPELNHNELQGYDGGTDAAQLTQPLVAVFLKDKTDHERVQRRMELTQQLLAEKGIRALEVDLPHQSRVQTLLSGWWLMRNVARGLAARYGVPPDETPLIAAFKKQL